MNTNKPPLWMFLLLGLSMSILAMKLLPRQEYFTTNWTASAPVGLYIKSSEDRATHVSFCLRNEHEVFGFFDQLCSPQSPGKTALLKAIGTRHRDGSFDVVGRGDYAIDSDLIGRVHPSQINNWWRPLMIWRISYEFISE